MPDETYRKTDHKYGEADHVRQKFTGYQKDAETGLDFAEARMYENRHGRFTAVDPLLASGKSADPQTFNRYVYVMNNPLVLTDPSGLQAGQPKSAKRPRTDAERERARQNAPVYSPSTATNQELKFAARYPLAAAAIGSASVDGTNISSIAARFAVNATWEDTGEGGKTNALRHVIWTAMMTSQLGEDIAQKAAGAHEGDMNMSLKSAADLPPGRGYTNMAEADTAVDQYNNFVGFVLGNELKGGPNKSIALTALKVFRDSGLFVVEKQEDGKFSIPQSRITQNEYEQSRAEFERRNERGFSPGYVGPSPCNTQRQCND